MTPTPFNFLNSDALAALWALVLGDADAFAIPTNPHLAALDSDERAYYAEAARAFVLNTTDADMRHDAGMLVDVLTVPAPAPVYLSIAA